MTELSGIVVTPGMMAAPLRESLVGAVDRIGAKIAETVRIDTTHFVCVEGRGREWEIALEQNIPVVRPEWVEGCEREGRLVGVRGYYLNADPKLRQVGQGIGIQQQQQQRSQQQQVRNDSQANLQRTSTIQQSPRSQQQETPVNSPRPGDILSSPLPDDSRPPPPAKDAPRHMQRKEEDEDLVSEPATASMVTGPQQPSPELEPEAKDDDEGSRTPGEGNFSEVTL